jgi:hypothetical protein
MNKFNYILKQYGVTAYFGHTAQNRDQWKVLANPAMKTLWYAFHIHSFDKINRKVHLSQKLHFYMWQIVLRLSRKCYAFKETITNIS